MPRKIDNEQPVIAAIGGSANGIKAMEAFFTNLGESTGIAFVIIQHLSPDHKSILPEILQKKTSLKVLEIENNTIPEPGHVYVLPAGFDVTISNNRFHLEKYSKDQKGLHLPIDLFLRSLATDRKDRTAAILLSGSGSDGLRQPEMKKTIIMNTKILSMVVAFKLLGISQLHFMSIYIPMFLKLNRC